MTIIVYRDGMLAADGSSIYNAGPSYVEPYVKIHISANKYMAFASTGHVLPEDAKPKLESLFLNAIYAALAYPDGETFIAKGDVDLIRGRKILVMTKTHAFLVQKLLDTKALPEAFQKANEGHDIFHFAMVPQGEFSCIGSGVNLALPALVAGKSALEVVKFACENDYLGFPVGDYQSVMASKLKALPKEITHG